MMTKFKRSIAAAIVATAVAGGGYAFLGSSLTPVAEARLRDHPKLEAAHDSLKEAKEYLEASSHNYHGHREAAVKALDYALHQIRICAEEADARDNFDRTPPKEFADHPKLHHAKEQVKAAREYLFESKHNYRGHKDEAIKALDAAVHHIQICLDD